MAKYTLTNEGAKLLARNLAGEGELVFTTFRLGSGNFTGDVKTVTDMVNQFGSYPVKNSGTQGDNLTIRLDSLANNTGFLQQQELREKGFYCQLGNDSSTEVLYSYVSQADYETLIPAASIEKWERTFKVLAQVNDATNITVNYTEKKDKYDFNTVAEMVAASYLVNGDRIKLWGYHSLGDGGGHERVVYNTNKSGMAIRLNNSLFADFIDFDNVNSKYLGYKADGTLEDSNILNIALSKFNDITISGDVLKLNKTIILDANYKTVKINCVIDGSSMPADSTGVTCIISGNDNKIVDGTIQNSNYYAVLLSGDRNEISNVKSHDIKYSAYVVSGDNNRCNKLYSERTGWDLAQNSGKNTVWENCHCKISDRHGFSTDSNSENISFINCIAEDVGGSLLAEGQDAFHFERSGNLGIMRNCKAIYTDNHRAFTNSTSLQFLKCFLTELSRVKITGFSVVMSDNFRNLIGLIPFSVASATGEVSEVTVDNSSFEYVNLTQFGNKTKSTFCNSNFYNCIFQDTYLNNGKTIIRHNVIDGNNLEVMIRTIGANASVKYDNYYFEIYENDIRNYDNIYKTITINSLFNENTTTDVGCIIASVGGLSSGGKNSLEIKGNHFINSNSNLIVQAYNNTKENLIVSDNTFSGIFNTILKNNFSSTLWENNNVLSRNSITIAQNEVGGNDLSNELKSWHEVGMIKGTLTTPVGSIVPDFIGQRYLTTNSKIFSSIGILDSDWIL